MSCGHGIDGNKTIFDFDDVESASVASLSDIPHFSALQSSYFATGLGQLSETHQCIPAAEDAELSENKGKAISRPLDITSQGVTRSRFDALPSSNGTAGPSSSGSFHMSLSCSLLSPSSTESIGCASLVSDIITCESPFSGDEMFPELGSWKGKSRAQLPTLPPSSFHSVLVQRDTKWPIDFDNSSNAESSNLFHPFACSTVCPNDVAYNGFDGTCGGDGAYPKHERSRSALSPHLSSILLSTAKTNPVKVNWQSNLSCKMHRQRFLDMGYASDFEDIAATNVSYEKGRHEPYVSVSAPITPYAYTSKQTNTIISELFSLEDTSQPRISFERSLPYEIKLEIFQFLIHLHEVDQKFTSASSAWTVSKACLQENRWTGRAKGFVELVKLSRVCKSWQRLAFDGQLWVNLSLRELPLLSQTLMLRLVALSGPFVRSLDLCGHSQLTSKTIMDMSNSLFSRHLFPDKPSQRTQLTEINLAGCSALTAQALHRIIEHSPALLKISMKGLPAVTNETCRSLAMYCPYITSLDLSGCRNMDADGVKSFITNNLAKYCILPLKELRISGLRRVDDSLLASLGRHCPALEILILSRIRELNDSAIEAFVSCTEIMDTSVGITSSSREGGDADDPQKSQRRLTMLRHLSLSYCPLLSDVACFHLAHAVPKLEYLELAGIGSELKDHGLVHLLATTPFIRRLDLDEACEITDSVLQALTPPAVPEGQTSLPVVVPGSQLEQLNLSYAMRLSNDALLILIRACTQLKKLEVDNTRISGVIIKEFVRLTRKRLAANAEIAINDCRGVGENAVRDLSALTRTRKGWRSWEARHLRYLDARDDENLGVGTDECDEYRVALKSFYTWQVVDEVEEARVKKRKVKGERAFGIDNGGDLFSVKRPSISWWSSARRASETTSPDFERESCSIM